MEFGKCIRGTNYFALEEKDKIYKHQLVTCNYIEKLNNSNKINQKVKKS